MTTGAMVLLPSAKARSWAKVKLAQHLFEHRYDYRAEWLRFAATIGRSGPDAPPLAERLIKAFADILDSPGGLLLVADENGAVSEGAEWNWQGGPFAPDANDAARWRELEQKPLILDIDALRIVANGVNRLHTPDNAVVLVTHYQRLLNYIVPDYVHVMDAGRIVKTGDKALAVELESRGYDWVARAQRAA